MKTMKQAYLGTLSACLARLPQFSDALTLCNVDLAYDYGASQGQFVGITRGPGSRDGCAGSYDSHMPQHLEQVL